MFENLYTTKMSMDKKKLQNRFSKIRSKTGRVSKMMAFLIFAGILLVIAFASVIIASNIDKNKDYTMTESEFADFVNRPIGAVMADIYYADDSKVVFHYGEGLFIIDRQDTNLNPMLSSEFDFVINLKKLNIAYGQQGSSVLDIKISKDGRYAYLSSAGADDEVKNFDKYIVMLDNGAVKKGNMPKNAELFTEIADTFTTVENPIGWYSNNCIVNEGKIYYLTSETGTVNGIQIITVNKADGEIIHKYVFNNNYMPVASQVGEFSPADIHNIVDVELVVGGIKYPLATTNAHTEIEEAFSSATKIKMGGTACPFNAELIFTRKDGVKGFVTIATDSCAVFKSGDTYYDYGDGDNSMLLGYFGLDINTVIDLTTINKSFMDNSETALLNFFKAFDKSDLKTMKTLVTNEFIAKGYIGDYEMCSGMTRATLDNYSKIDADELLDFYFKKPEHTRFTLSENDIKLLETNSDDMSVYYVTVTAEHNIKGKNQPPFENKFYVICKKQNNGSYLVHKLVN
ncbi:MAG: hypothetical protein E7406_02845 [Ruminococcaceae bacterium]|nr:hypothetical protein [Oscillospiraceae bacterium]